jgi:hypothetical protein
MNRVDLTGRVAIVIGAARGIRRAIAEIAGLVAWLSIEECSSSTGGVFDISGARATY